MSKFKIGQKVIINIDDISSSSTAVAKVVGIEGDLVDIALLVYKDDLMDHADETDLEELR